MVCVKRHHVSSVLSIRIRGTSALFCGSTEAHQQTGSLVSGHLPTLGLNLWDFSIHKVLNVARKVGRVARNENESGQRFYGILPEFRMILVLIVRFM